MVKNFKSEVSIEELSEIMHQIDLIWHDLDSVNRYICKTINADVSFEVMGVVIRYTAYAKDSLPDWQKSLQKYKAQLDQNGLNSCELLMGLE